MSQGYLDSLINKSSEDQHISATAPDEPPQPKLKPILSFDEEYDSLKPEETFRKFSASVREMLSRYEGDKAELARLENEMQDILHFIEMGKDKNAPEGYKLYKKLSEVRRQRRICKSEIDLLSPVYELFHATDMLNKLANVQGQCRKMKETIDDRKYAVRTDILGDFIN